MTGFFERLSDAITESIERERRRQEHLTLERAQRAVANVASPLERTARFIAKKQFGEAGSFVATHILARHGHIGAARAVTHTIWEPTGTMWDVAAMARFDTSVACCMNRGLLDTILANRP